MPGLFHRPLDRRSFLRVSSSGAAAVVAARLMPSRAGETGPEFHLALLSDTHIPGDRINGHRGFNPWENLRQIVPSVAAASPEGVVICGDAARLEGLPADYDELKALLEPLAVKAPIYIALGNHDDRENFRKAFSPAAGPGAEVGNKHVLVVEHEVGRFVVLDSLLFVNKTPGHLGKAQRDWLAGFVERHADRPIVVFVHHTLGDRDGDLLDADRLFGLLRPHAHVKAIFYGHSHVWEVGARDGLKLINLPAVGYNFSDDQPVGWVDARFDARGVRLTLRALGGNREGDGLTTAVSWG